MVSTDLILAGFIRVPGGLPEPAESRKRHRLQTEERVVQWVFFIPSKPDTVVVGSTSEVENNSQQDETYDRNDFDHPEHEFDLAKVFGGKYVESDICDNHHGYVD